jgi:hypothetical protein
MYSAKRTAEDPVAAVAAVVGTITDRIAVTGIVPTPTTLLKALTVSLVWLIRRTLQLPMEVPTLTRCVSVLWTAKIRNIELTSI